MIKKEKLTTTHGLVLFIGSDIVGRGEDYQLGNLLMQKFLHTIGGHRLKPETVVLMNNGAKLATQDSLVVGELKRLAKQGVDILVCGTCLSRFQLTEKVAVGQVSNMSDITDTLLKAVKVISI